MSARGRSPDAHRSPEEDLAEALEDIATLACRGVAGCDTAGINVRLLGRERVLAFSSEAAQAIDTAQYEADDGPCLVSMREGVDVEVADYADEQRWPSVARAAIAVGMRCSLSLPLRDESRVLGALNLYGPEPDSFDPESHRVAEVLARQASSALRALELLEAERERRRTEQQIAETLQRSLLPALPELPGMVCAARYLVAADSAQVGGDWYDAFRLPDGAVGVAVGDVMGHDIAAAAAMGQLRSVLRSYAYEGTSPSAVLDRLDRLVQGFDMAHLATAVYGRLILDWDGAMLLFCNAGHLPPLLRLPSGEVRRLEGATCQLIGAPLTVPSSRSESAVVLPRGSTLLLYTDGLVERRNRGLDEGVDLLSEALAQCPADCTPDELCDRVLNATADGGYEDDVALLALRIS